MRDLQTRNAACFDRSFARTAEAVMEPSAASSRGQLRVFVTSCELGEDAWRGQEERLKHLYELSDKRYALTNDPGSADIILIGDVRGEAWGKKILEHPLINKDVDRCFSLSHASQPVILHHGVYTGAAKSILNLGRVRTGAVCGCAETCVVSGFGWHPIIPMARASQQARRSRHRLSSCGNA